MSETGLALDFKLTRQAKRGGGDRYECEIESEIRPIVFYIPQTISRNSTGLPLDKLVIVISQGA